ncbi:PKD domain-containing protein [Lysobacter korlensis]|uniref:PKD domain-containing protein n=1 Tax=Lysobacter korlensis TaxID=553636 RepID=A0ABV6RNZ4_9GAMM
MDLLPTPGPGANGEAVGPPLEPAEPVEPPLRWDWTVEGAPEVTLTDLASFVPTAGVSVGEPAGWGIVGLETNFYAETGVQELEGELLGIPATVRFTPVAWHWSYGDGTRAVTSTAGGPWGSADEFEPTPTSHRYSSTGTYAVGLTVEFGAEYRFGPLPWRTVDGTVVADAPPLSVRIGTADTLLVERGCEAASGPGC